MYGKESGISSYQINICESFDMQLKKVQLSNTSWIAILDDELPFSYRDPFMSIVKLNSKLSSLINPPAIVSPQLRTVVMLKLR
jgi:hypothetical protein